MIGKAIQRLYNNPIYTIGMMIGCGVFSVILKDDAMQYVRTFGLCMVIGIGFECVQMLAEKKKEK